MITKFCPTAPPATGLFPVTVAVGRFALEAKIGEPRGKKSRRPDRARIARIVPELNFVRYAFVGVFIIFRGSVLNRLFKGDG